MCSNKLRSAPALSVHPFFSAISIPVWTQVHQKLLTFKIILNYINATIVALVFCMIELSNRRDFLVRTLALGASALGGPLLGAGCSQDGLSTPVAAPIAASSANSPIPINPKIVAVIGNQTVQREQVLEWEARRLQVLAQRMKSNLPAATLLDLSALLIRPSASIDNIAQERELLAQAKIKAGDEAMRALVRNDLMISDPASSLAVSANQFAASVTELYCDLGSAEGFVEWFSNQTAQDNQLAMLRACPDHYLIRRVGGSGQEVIEETGGALVVSHFQIDYDQEGRLPHKLEPELPVRLRGPAKNKDGVQIGGVLHQFGNLPTGFKSKLTVYFPATLPFWYVTEHRWHLACEFSNWVTAYLKDTKQIA